VLEITAVGVVSEQQVDDNQAGEDDNGKVESFAVYSDGGGVSSAAPAWLERR